MSASELNSLDGIAVVGMSGRFPGARNVDEFWANLVGGHDTVSRFSKGELEFSSATPEAVAQGQKFIGARSILSDVDKFDAGFFGIYPREAELMDPQHRLWLECAWESLESAGYDPEIYPGMIGVYAGCSLNTYLLYNLGKGRELATRYQVGAYSTMLGNDKDFLPTRISYKLNLRGPSMAIQCACSTSLVAISQACNALLNYQCDMALAGGASISFPQKRDYLYEEDGMVSVDGTCRAFDANAQGTVFGHGVAVVLLKRVQDAIADKDPILAIIKGSAVNNDGSAKIGYAAPSVTAQADVIAMAQAAAGVTPDQISYIEAHGTGTPLGDPIEVAALTQAFRAGGATQNGYCTIGTGKTHIGHLDVAAGATGLIKTILQFRHETIPALLHYRSPNPKIDFASSPFQPAAKNLSWTRGDAPRRAGVSAFGVGGTNAHVVLEEPPVLEPTSGSRSDQLLVLSAKSPRALQNAAKNLATHLQKSPDASLADVAFTLQCGRRRFSHRAAIVAANRDDAMAKLNAFDATAVTAAKNHAQLLPVIFLFPGQGAQFVDMGRSLYETESVFRDEVDRCAEILRPLLGRDLRQILYPETDYKAEASRQINETSLTQPSIFVVEYALARLWMSWGIQPSLLIGHSIGEYVAAVLAETLSLADALQLLAERARLMQSLPAGSMLAVRLGAEAMQPLLPPGTAIAAINSPKLVVVSGPTDTLKALETELQGKQIGSRFLPTSHAFHSPMMEPMLPQLRTAAAAVKFHAPKLPWISTLTGDWMKPDEIAQPEYWTRQVREAVRFADAVGTALKHEATAIFLEVGPGQALSQLTRQHSAKTADHGVVDSLGRWEETGRDLASMLTALGQLWVAGVKPDWEKFYLGETRRKAVLPTYPFERESYWIEPPKAQPVEVAIPSLPLPLPTAPNVTAPTLIIAAPNTPTFPSESPVPAMPSSTTSRKDRIAARLRTLVKELSGVDVTSDTTSFMELGFDSLFLTQASQAFQTAFGIKVTFRQMFSELSTVDALAQHFDKQLPPSAFAEAPAMPAPAPAPAAPVAMANNFSAPAAVSIPTLQAPASGSLMEQLLFTQLQLTQMLIAQQRGQPAAPVAAAAVPAATSSTSSSLPAVRWPNANPPVNVPTAGKQEFKRFGPYKPIDSGEKGGLTPRQQKALDELIARYVKKSGASKKYTAENRPHFADPRAVAGFKSNWKEMVYPIVVERSKGSKVWDVDGNEYLDVTMGFGTYFFGHSPDWLMEALHKQLNTGIEIGPQHPLAGKVAKLVSEFTGLDRVAFCNTGSEAVMAAIRLARTITGRKRIVYFTGDYHGMFEEVLVRGSWVNGEYRAQPIAPGIPSSLVENMLVLDYAAPESLEIIKQHANEIAAVLVEPVQSRQPGLQPREFMHALRSLTAANEIALIFDEVVTGFRCHPGGAQAYFGVKADMATYGKVIGGGIPIGVLAGQRKYMDALDGGAWNYGDDSIPEVGVTFFAGTFVRHPLALAAAYRVLNFLKEKGPSLQSDMTARVARTCTSLNQHFEKIGVPIRLPHFSAFAVVDHAHDLKYASLLWFYLREKGIHIWEGRPCYFTIAHTDEDLALFVAKFKEAVADMQRDGFLPESQGERPTSPDASSPRNAASLVSTTENKGGSSNGVAHANGTATAVLKTGSRFPLAAGQQEMWLGAQMSPEAAGPQHACNAIDFHGKLDVGALRRAIQTVVDRHEALSCTFDGDGREVILHPTPKIDLPLLDLSGLPPSERNQRVHAIMQEEGRRIFDLAKLPLYAFRLIKLSDEDHRLIFTAQMIVCDGWSHYVVFEELSAAYSAFVEGREFVAPPASPIRDYALWQLEHDNDEEAKRCAEYWLSEYKAVPPPLDLPTSRPRPPARTVSGARRELTLTPKFYGEIKQAARAQKSSSFAYLLAAFQTWIHRLSGARDIVIGVPFSAQGSLGLDKLVGQCANTLPLRAKLDPTEPFTQLLDRAWNALLNAQENWNYTFGKLVPHLQLPNDPSRIPLVSVLFNIDPPMSKVAFTGLTHKFNVGPRFYFQYDLGFNLVEEDGGLKIECDYNSDLFESDAIDAWLASYEVLLRGINERRDAPLSTLPMVEDVGLAELVAECAEPASTPEPETTLPRLVQEQCRRTPSAVAIRAQGTTQTYAELAARTNRLANFLLRHNVSSGAKIAVCCERNAELPSTLLAIMAGGAVYIPIDPAFPADRKAHLIADSGAEWVLTDSTNEASVPATSAKIIVLDRDAPAINRESTEEPRRSPQPDDLAYILYTSGSTGTPKGVEIAHRSVVNFLKSMAITPGVRSHDVVLAIAPITFDISILEIFLPLTVGASSAIIAREIAIDPTTLGEAIKSFGATVVQATPSTWRMLLDAGWRGSKKLRLLCGGEALHADLANRLLECGDELWNLYGPTETTVWSALSRVLPKRPVTIGSPIRETTIALVDGNLQPVPVGVPGEILIGGVGLARGYHNLPALTQEKFIVGSGTGPLSGRLYRTGDMARRRADGEIEFIGRRDLQVKIRGCHVEIGEIENQIRVSPEVRETAVALHGDGSSDAMLVAYVVPVQEVPVPKRAVFQRELRQLLRTKLPDYMVPSRFVLLDRLPRSFEGKLDRSALPPPPKELPDFLNEYLPPQTDTQKMLARIWQDVLRVERVGLKDNFFEIGGQSLRAVMIFARIEQETQRKLPLATLFRAPTVEQLAAIIDGNDSGARAWPSLVPIQTRGAKPPLFLVHGAGGNVLLYRTLADHLGSDYPLYGLQSQGLDGQATPLSTIETMAAHYIKEMREVQPNGPYYLGGYCLGGTVAYEMAQQLRAVGQDVGLVAMLDTYNFSVALKSSFVGFMLEKIRFHLGNFVRLRPSEMRKYLREKFRLAKDGEIESIFSSRPGTAVQDGLARATSGIEASVQAINDTAAEIYLPKRFSGCLTLFKPHKNYKFYPDPKMGWGDLVETLDIVEMQINPHAMLMEPYVVTLADELRRRIDGRFPETLQPGANPVSRQATAVG